MDTVGGEVNYLRVCTTTPPLLPILTQGLWFKVCLGTEVSSHVLHTAQRRGFVAQKGVAFLLLAHMMPLRCYDGGVENKMVY